MPKSGLCTVLEEEEDFILKELRFYKPHIRVKSSIIKSTLSLNQTRQKTVNVE
jgi:hypothetical protein